MKGWVGPTAVQDLEWCLRVLNRAYDEMSDWAGHAWVHLEDRHQGAEAWWAWQARYNWRADVVSMLDRLLVEVERRLSIG